MTRESDPLDRLGRVSPLDVAYVALKAMRASAPGHAEERRFHLEFRRGRYLAKLRPRSDDFRLDGEYNTCNICFGSDKVQKSFGACEHGVCSGCFHRIMQGGRRPSCRTTFPNPSDGVWWHTPEAVASSSSSEAGTYVRDPNGNLAQHLSDEALRFLTFSEEAQRSSEAPDEGPGFPPEDDAPDEGPGFPPDSDEDDDSERNASTQPAAAPPSNLGTIVFRMLIAPRLGQAARQIVIIPFNRPRDCHNIASDLAALLGLRAADITSLRRHGRDLVAWLTPIDADASSILSDILARSSRGVLTTTISSWRLMPVEEGLLATKTTMGNG